MIQELLQNMEAKIYELEQNNKRLLDWQDGFALCTKLILSTSPLLPLSIGCREQHFNAEEQGEVEEMKSKHLVEESAAVRCSVCQCHETQLCRVFLSCSQRWCGQYEVQDADAYMSTGGQKMNFS